MYPYEELHHLRANGQADSAYEHGLELLKSHPGDHNLQAEFAWVLVDKARQITESDGSANQIDELLREFDRLELPGSGRQFSAMVGQCVLLDPVPTYLPEFVMSAGLGAFQREDLVAAVSEQGKKRQPSLVETTAVGIGKLLANSREHGTPAKEFALELVEMTLEKAQVCSDHMLRYVKALILGGLMRTDEACEAMEQVVKAKIDEHWTWHALARLEAARNVNGGIALGVRAYQICEQEQYTVQLLSDIRLMSLKAGRHDLAKWAGDEEFDIRMANGWKIYAPLAKLGSAPWYQAAKQIPNLKEELEQMAATAEERLFAGDWVDGNVIGSFESKAGTQLFKVWLAGRQNELVTPVSINPELVGQPVGTPVQAVIHELGRYPKLLKLKGRPEGRLYDNLLNVHGIVDHQNVSRELVSVYVTAHEYCLLPYSKFNGVSAFSPGTPLRMRCSRWKDRLFAYEVSPSEWSDTEWVTRFRGPLRRHSRGFAFVEEVFVPPPLIPPNPDIEVVSGICIQKPKWKGATELGWTALTVVPEETTRVQRE